jgi:RHS repeat-associated protein
VCYRNECYANSRSTGKERDQETGLDYFGARYYSGPEGRFMSPDPGAFKLEDPRTFNRYAYVNNNPLKYVDPSGREANYAIDWANHTITFHVSVVIWGEGVDEGWVNRIKHETEAAWQGVYKDKKSGVIFKVSTEVDVSIYGGNPSGKYARNAFYIGKDVFYSHFDQGTLNTNAFRRRYPNDPGVRLGQFDPSNPSIRHEMGHVLGLPDDYERDNENDTGIPKAGHKGHLMADATAKNSNAAQDEIDRLGSYVLGQNAVTHKNGGTIIRLPEPPSSK